jgi:hypothetical protein
MGCEKMEETIERKILTVFVLLLLVASSIVSFTGNMPTVYTVKADETVDNTEYDWEDSSESNYSWHNTTYLNVTVESKYPKILWYDIQKYVGTKEENDATAPGDNNLSNWTSIRNNMTEVDNATWLRIVVNVSSDQGWGNIEYINITGWHDNWDSTLDVDTGDKYNTSGNHGSNRNFFLSYHNENDTMNNSEFNSDNESYNIKWPNNGTEMTKGGFTSVGVEDNLGIEDGDARNLTFEFKPSYQFRYAPGPDGTGNGWTNHTVENRGGLPYSAEDGVVDYERSSWEQIENLGSWNFNITVKNRGQRNNDSHFDESGFKTWALDEFGVYPYTEIVSAENVGLTGAPGESASTNSGDPYTTGSENVTVKTRSNGNYSLVVNISDLKHVSYDELSGDAAVEPYLKLDNETIFIRGGNLTTAQNFSNDGTEDFIALYGDITRTTGAITRYEKHEVNGTYKLAGENGTDGLDNNYPNDYNETDTDGHRVFNGLNNRSYYIEFRCDIPSNQWPGKYTTNVYYHLRTETQD